ncbi:hypothetical protein SNEBB_000376 [Seison nebaliae]|nr:hypothetical protein SNEBB_000376 [Seison nebaliae]
MMMKRNYPNYQTTSYEPNASQYQPEHSRTSLNKYHWKEEDKPNELYSNWNHQDNPNERSTNDTSLRRISKKAIELNTLLNKNGPTKNRITISSIKPDLKSYNNIISDTNKNNHYYNRSNDYQTNSKYEKTIEIQPTKYSVLMQPIHSPTSFNNQNYEQNYHQNQQPSLITNYNNNQRNNFTHQPNSFDNNNSNQPRKNSIVTLNLRRINTQLNDSESINKFGYIYYDPDKQSINKQIESNQSNMDRSGAMPFRRTTISSINIPMADYDNAVPSNKLNKWNIKRRLSSETENIKDLSTDYDYTPHHNPVGESNNPIAIKISSTAPTIHRLPKYNQSPNNENNNMIQNKFSNYDYGRYQPKYSNFSQNNDKIFYPQPTLQSINKPNSFYNPDSSPASYKPDLSSTSYKPDIPSTSYKPDIPSTSDKPDLASTSYKPNLSPRNYQPEPSLLSYKSEPSAMSYNPDQSPVSYENRYKPFSRPSNLKLFTPMAQPNIWQPQVHTPKSTSEDSQKSFPVFTDSYSTGQTDQENYSNPIYQPSESTLVPQKIEPQYDEWWKNEKDIENYDRNEPNDHYRMGRPLARKTHSEKYRSCSPSKNKIGSRRSVMPCCPPYFGDVHRRSRMDLKNEHKRLAHAIAASLDPSVTERLAEREKMRQGYPASECQSVLDTEIPDVVLRSVEMAKQQDANSQIACANDWADTRAAVGEISCPETTSQISAAHAIANDITGGLQSPFGRSSGKGAKLFQKRRERSEKFIVDEQTRNRFQPTTQTPTPVYAELPIRYTQSDADEISSYDRSSTNQYNFYNPEQNAAPKVFPSYLPANLKNEKPSNEYSDRRTFNAKPKGWTPNYTMTTPSLQSFSTNTEKPNYTDL